MALKGKWVDKVNGVDMNNADDINQVAQAVIELEGKTDDINVITSRLTNHEKRIEVIEQKLNFNYFVTDASATYTKDVPVNALPWAELAKVGGMSYEEGGVLKSAPVTGIVSVGANLTTAQAVYEGSDKYLETVMDDRNCVRFTSGVRLKKTPIAFKPNTQYTVSFYAKGENFMGAAATNNGFTFYYEDGTSTSIDVNANSPWTLFTLTSQSGKTVTAIGVESNEYRAYVYLDTDTFMLNKGNTALPYAPYTERTTPIPEAVQSLDGYGEGNPDNAEEYNAIIYIDGKWRYSHKGNIVDNAWTPLAEPIITDISDILTDDNYIEVEGGGTLTFENEYKLAVPSEITYQLKGATV